jgi:hypothetical protein
MISNSLDKSSGRSSAGINGIDSDSSFKKHKSGLNYIGK